MLHTVLVLFRISVEFETRKVCVSGIQKLRWRSCSGLTGTRPGRPLQSDCNRLGPRYSQARGDCNRDRSPLQSHRFGLERAHIHGIVARYSLVWGDCNGVRVCVTVTQGLTVTRTGACSSGTGTGCLGPVPVGLEQPHG